ncbi:MAG: ABC transporter permease [Kofleriaceae bacterium]|nr:ABC transporter permease [Kofleriaceae bacterium]
MVRDTLVIGRRELLERVRSKWFVVMTLLGPLFMVALVVVPALIASKSAAGARVEIIDKTGRVGPGIVAELKDWHVTIVSPDTPDAVEMARIRDDKINGFIVVPANGLEGGTIFYRGDNASSQKVQADLYKSISRVVQVERAKAQALNEAQTRAMLTRIDVVPQHTTGETEGMSGIGSFFVAYLLAFILYMVITLYGVTVMRSVVQEKTSRVMEFLVAAVKPSSLMSGKILGVGGAALIQLTIWLGIGALALEYKSELLGLFGVKGDGLALPPVALPELTLVLAFFLLGFFFYAAMYAAVGAMVSSEQDTQQVQMPVTMLLVIGVTCITAISSDPRGGAASVMTMVPCWSPILMPMRYVLGGATFGEVALSLGILVVSTILIVRAAAKIYRVGVLMYGKRPSVRELVRWLRY